MVALICTIGCGAHQEQADDVKAVYDQQTGRLRQLTYDANKNGKPDGIAYMDGTRVLRVELDRDEDGTVERWEYYDANQQLEKVGFSKANDGTVDHWAYRAADGTLLKMEVSTRRDGNVQRTEIYDRDALAAVEEDTDGDGAVDKWETYSGGTLKSVAFDTEGTGRPGRRLEYAADGSIRVQTIAANAVAAQR